MKIIAFLALFALAAHAFNTTSYHLGFDSVLGFNSTEIQEDFTCWDALNMDAAQIISLIESGNFDNIVTDLGDLIEQTKTDFLVTCKPYWYVIAVYLYENSQPQNLTEVMKENFEQYYPQILQKLAQWATAIQSENGEYTAGQIQAEILQILWGVVQPSALPTPVANATVPFNTSKFWSEYLGTVFQYLNIQTQVNVSAFVDCAFNVHNVTDIILYIKSQFSTMDFNQKLDGVQYALSHIFYTIRSCEVAGYQVSLLYTPVFKAFAEDPIQFTLTVAERIAADMPEYVQSIRQEIVDIQEGEYDLAGEEKADRIENDFAGLVNFTSTEVLY